LRAPSFSHSKKDPVADDIDIEAHYRVVILEGLYANVDEGEWAKAASLYDERWVVVCDEKIARGRLIARHVVTGVAMNRDEAQWRGGYYTDLM
jgi:pantothenate kinase